MNRAPTDTDHWQTHPSLSRSYGEAGGGLIRLFQEPPLKHCGKQGGGLEKMARSANGPYRRFSQMIVFKIMQGPLPERT